MTERNREFSLSIMKKFLFENPLISFVNELFSFRIIRSPSQKVSFRPVWKVQFLLKFGISTVQFRCRSVTQRVKIEIDAMPKFERWEIVGKK